MFLAVFPKIQLLKGLCPDESCSTSQVLLGLVSFDDADVCNDSVFGQTQTSIKGRLFQNIPLYLSAGNQQDFTSRNLPLPRSLLARLLI